MDSPNSSKQSSMLLILYMCYFFFLSFKYENFLGEREEKKIAKEDEKNYS